jgi:hypothetical protein
MVACISVIEHIIDHKAAFAGMLKVTKPGGHIVITTPYNERHGHPNVYSLSDAAYGKNLPYTCRSSTREDVESWCKLGATIVDQQFWQLWSGDTWTQGTFLPKPVKTSVAEPHQLICALFQKA